MKHTLFSIQCVILSVDACTVLHHICAEGYWVYLTDDDRIILSWAV